VNVPEAVVGIAPVSRDRGEPARQFNGFVMMLGQVPIDNGLTVSNTVP
jgi:hypothetical protein